MFVGSPCNFFQSPALLCKLLPVGLQILQDLILDDSRPPDPCQLGERTSLVADALVQHLRHWLLQLLNKPVSILLDYAGTKKIY